MTISINGVTVAQTSVCSKCGNGVETHSCNIKVEMPNLNVKPQGPVNVPLSDSSMVSSESKTWAAGFFAGIAVMAVLSILIVNLHGL